MSWKICQLSFRIGMLMEWQQYQQFDYYTNITPTQSSMQWMYGKPSMDNLRYYQMLNYRLNHLTYLSTSLFQRFYFSEYSALGKHI